MSIMICKNCGADIGFDHKCPPSNPLDAILTTPPKGQPSVQGILDNLNLADYPITGWSDEAKAQLLAHALSLLPEKSNGRDEEDRGFNEAIDLMELSLREGYE